FSENRSHKKNTNHSLESDHAIINPSHLRFYLLLGTCCLSPDKYPYYIGFTIHQYAWTGLAKTGNKNEMIDSI
ncbi:MAG: hypothetical protein ABSG06_08760, partial [Methanoregula sp.]